MATSGTLASNRITGEKNAALDLQGATAIRLNFGGADSVDIAIAPNSSLEAIRNAINAHKDAGVNATIINDGEGYRLALSSKATGADASIEGFSFVDTSQDPAATVGPFSGCRHQAFWRKALTVNGIAISSAKNQIQGPFRGLRSTWQS